METVSLFKIPVARVTEPEVVEHIVALAREGRARRGHAAFVATLNVDFVCNAVRGWPFGGNDELWGYLQKADLVTADGMPIVLLSRIMFRGLPERVTGADMVPAICRRCAEEGLSVYVLGGDKDAVEDAFEKIGLGHETPDARREETSRPTSDASGQKPSFRVAGIDPAFVKLDEPQPEIVERINAARLDVGAIIGIGGTFNFIAGRVKRAPKWVQRSGLEWIYRIIQEPARLWRRYAYGLVKFSWLSLLSVFGAYGKCKERRDSK